jgi:galactokinase
VSDVAAPALGRVYGHDSPLLDEQAARYQRGMREFLARFGSGPVTIYRSPGRVNLIGEHTDYNHGFVLPVALDRDVLVYTRRRDDTRVRMQNIEPDFAAVEFALSHEIARRPTGHWANYAQGPAQMLERECGPGLHGMDALVDGAPPYGVPRGAGLSSSSALTVAAAVALAGVNDIALPGPTLAELCGRAEWYVGTRGGVMDQFIAVLAGQGQALFLDCRPRNPDNAYTYRHVSLPSGYAVVVVDSGVRHQNTGPHFNVRVAEGRIGVRLLQAHYPGITHLRDVQDTPWAAIEPLLPEEISDERLREMGIDPTTILDGGITPDTHVYHVRRRCRHVLSENRRVLDTVAALETGDMAHAGELLRQAHISARDDYDISTPEIEALISIADETPGVVGARLTGAGWGGCIVALVRQDAVHDVAATIPALYNRRTGRDASLLVCRSAAGAGAVRPL